MAVVLQKNILFSGTIRENLRWGNENATDGEIERACCLAQADEFIRQFPDQYETYIDQEEPMYPGTEAEALYCQGPAQEA